MSEDKEHTQPTENDQASGFPVDPLVMLEKLKEMTSVQCDDGNWNYDPYMHGMANGIIFAVAFLEDKEPVYLDGHKQWLADKKDKAPAFTDCCE